MNRFLILLLFSMINSGGLAQSPSQNSTLSLNEIQANGVMAAIEYYRNHYSFKIYKLIIAEEGDDIMVSFDIVPKKFPSEIHAGGEFIQITYSKKSLGIIKAAKVMLR